MAVSVTYKLDTASVGRVIIACQFCRLRANSFSHTVPSSMLYICCTQIYQDRSDLQLEMRSIQSPWRHPMSRSKTSVFPFVIRSQGILLFRFVCPVVTLRPNSSASSFQTCALRSDISTWSCQYIYSSRRVCPLPTKLAPVRLRYRRLLRTPLLG